MNRLKPLILVGVCACILSPSKSQSALTDILQKYCVPTSGSNCTGLSRATYNTSRSACECSACNMYYDKNSRTCKSCAAGYFSDSKTATECKQAVCASGYYRVMTSGCN